MKSPSNEYNLINSLQSILTEHSSFYELEIGDDAAIRKNNGDDKLIFTADISVENIHFRTDWMSFFEIGYKAMVTNVSDCASMGAIPDSALVQIVFNKNDPDYKKHIEEIYTGFNEVCKAWKFPVVGGDLSQGFQWTIGITLIGRIPSTSRALKRTGAHSGDKLWISGMPGMSAAGLDALLKWGRKDIPDKYLPYVQAHVCPEPKVELGIILREIPQIHAMMDLSDGLAKDCRTLAYENRLGIILNIDASQFPQTMIELGEELKKSCLDWVINGGEEYELLFAASPLFEPPMLPESYNQQLLCIGTFSSECSGLNLQNESGIAEIVGGGWDHL